MSDRKRPPVVLLIIPLLIGLLGFYRLAESPQFESYRTVDVIQLVATGACIGVALTGLMVRLLRPRTGHKSVAVREVARESE
jgi:hypothetical protein